MNTLIAVNLSRVVIHVLGYAPPSMPPRGVPLLSVLKCKGRTIQEEFDPYVNWRVVREARGMGCLQARKDEFGPCLTIPRGVGFCVFDHSTSWCILVRGSRSESAYIAQVRQR